MTGRNLLACLALVACPVGVALADAPFYGYQSENTSFGFEMTSQPIFPHGLRSAGVSGGEAVFLLEIDEYGNLNDFLALEATHREFADAVEDVAYRWRYLPTRFDGEPSGIIMKLRVTFRNEGDLVVLDSIGAMSAGLASAATSGNAIRLYRVDELDDFLLPVHQEPLSYVPYLEPGSDPVEFVMDFYVDRQGRVRMPRMRYDGSEVRDELIIAAQESLSKWRFQPPRAKGRPVMVQAAQPFVIYPADE